MSTSDSEAPRQHDPPSEIGAVIGIVILGIVFFPAALVIGLVLLAKKSAYRTTAWVGTILGGLGLALLLVFVLIASRLGTAANHVSNTVQTSPTTPTSKATSSPVTTPSERDTSIDKIVPLPVLPENPTERVRWLFQVRAQGLCTQNLFLLRASEATYTTWYQQDARNMKVGPDCDQASLDPNTLVVLSIYQATPTDYDVKYHISAPTDTAADANLTMRCSQTACTYIGN